MANQPRLLRSLAINDDALQQFVSSKDFRRLNDDDKSFILGLQNSIATLHAQRGWNRKAGRIAQGGDIRQDELIDEAIKTDIATRKFSDILISKMQTMIAERLTQPITAPMRILLLKLKTNNAAVLDIIHEQETQTQVAEEHPFIHSLTLSASILGGRYIPGAQLYDPLAGAEANKNNPGRYSHSQGHCFGHMMAWRNEVSEKGYSELLARQTTLSHQYQQSQRDIKLGFWHGRSKGEAIHGATIHPTKPIHSAITKLIDRVTTKHIYELALNWNKTHSAHATGIRKLPSGEYEFFDANYGLFVFKNRQQLEDWLVILVDDYAAQHGYDGYLSLINIGTQPAQAKASIPPVANFKVSAEYPLDLFTLSTLEFNEQYPQHQEFDKREASLQRLHQAYVNQIGVMAQNLPHENLEKLLGNRAAEEQILLDQVIWKRKLSTAQQSQQIILIQDHQKALQQSVIERIQKEMSRLTFPIITKKDKMMIAALTELTNRIEAAQASTLTNVIDHWLASNSKLIHGSKTEKFIRHLSKHAEISPYRLYLLQTMLLQRTIETVFNRDWSSTTVGKKLPQTIVALKNKITACLAEGKSPAEILLEIKAIAKSSVGNFFYRVAHGRSRELNEFYRCLSQIELEDPYQLSCIQRKIQTLDEEKLRLTRLRPEQKPAETSQTKTPRK